MRNKAYVVGIGSSAGGIEALIKVVSALPVEGDISYIIAQHLSPKHKSQMKDILGRETSLKVIEAANNTPLQKCRIYVAPAGRHVRLKDSRLYLDPEPDTISPKPSVNILFESIAEECGDQAIGVVLSGTGSDGSAGLKAIKGAGGFTIVQEPNSAKYDGMPLSAINALDVDKVVVAENIGMEIANLDGDLSEEQWPVSDKSREETLDALFALVEEKTKIDFSYYKQSTLLRRLNRRINATSCESLGMYLDKLKSSEKEVHALSRELLISVTSFFRDKSAFSAVREHVAAIVNRKKDGGNIRVWVPGCATGEEAYSVAILFLSEISKQNRQISVKVFATDIDENALQVARKGSYSASAVDALDAELVKTYFQFSQQTYVPTKQLRESITVSRQDITQDPPFLHLDMVTFRNVMIYFTSALQKRVLSILSYALNPDGILFLGSSESPGSNNDSFVAVDRKWRIFRVGNKTKQINLPELTGIKGPASEKKGENHSFNEQTLIEAAKAFVSPCVLINEQFRILHTHGNIQPFIEFPSGAPELFLSKMILPELIAELVSGVAKARRDGRMVQSRQHRLREGDKQLWHLSILPVKSENPDRFLVHFSSARAPIQIPVHQGDDESTGESADVAELLNAKEQLQTLTEEMAASAEEMQGLNEEVQATNEELQANNEELEATNEELKATNEELVDVNQERMRKSTELTDINTELESMYDTIDFPVMVFDPKLRLKRSNDKANRKFHLNIGIYRKTIKEMNLPSYFTEIEAKLKETITCGGKMNFLLQPYENETYNVFVTPVVSHESQVTSIIVVLINNSELVKAHNQMEKSQAQLLAIMNNSLSVVALKDTAGRYEFVNAQFENTFGLGSSEVIGRTDKQIFDEVVAKQLRERDLETMRTLMPNQSTDEIFTSKGKVTLESMRFPVLDNDGTIKSVCTQANDISNARHANEQLRLAGKLFDRSGEAILVTDEAGLILTTNKAFTDFSGYPVKELVGANPSILSSGRHSAGFYQNMYFTLEEHGYWQGEIINRSKSGEDYTTWLTINTVKDNSGKVANYVASYSDINEIKNVQRKIEFLATHDELTRLPNRNLLMERLDIMLSHARREDALCAILFFDLDDFKNINDSLGHDVGDLLLKEVAKRLHKCIRDTDVLARMGGDEFVAIVSGREVLEIEDVAKRIINTISAPFDIDQHALFVSASMGIAIFPSDGDNNFTLLKNADTAMYLAKELGRNQYQYFTQQMREDAERKMEIERCLRSALENEHFEVKYQPQIDPDTGTIVGAEALLRCDNGVLEATSTDVFIEVAERGRLIDDVGMHVLTRVLLDIKSWHDAGLVVPRIAINVSPKQLKNNKFIGKARALLEDLDISPSLLTIEVTERALMDKVDKSIEVLNQLSAMGMHISVDDFGVGQSSLSYLRKLPIDELKVDQSFITNLVTEPDDRAITNSIIRMGHALGLKVVAEGVETQAQLDMLRPEKCDVVQGFHFYEPLSAETFTGLLAQGS